MSVAPFVSFSFQNKLNQPLQPSQAFTLVVNTQSLRNILSSPLSIIMRPVTSSVDWCEPNYLYPNTPVLKYVAEQFNTWSAILYLIFAMLYLFNAYQLQRKRVIDYVRPRFIMNSLGLLVVGIGTFLFHATLSREHQILDELSMNVGIIINVYILLNDAQPAAVESSSTSNRRTISYETFRKLTLALTAALMCLIMMLYDQTNPLKFRTVFGVVTFSLAFYCVYKTFYHNSHVAKMITEEESRSYTAKKLTLLKGIFIFGLTGFGMWLVERTLCFEPLKLHAWWHFFTGLAAYCGMYMSMFSFYYDSDVFSGKAHQDRVRLEWHLGVFPWIHGTSNEPPGGMAVAGKVESAKKQK